MKILIKEGIVKKMVNRVLGYDLSNDIKIVTNWIELGSRGQRLFSDGRDDFRWYINTFGPMYLFDVNGEIYLVQYLNGDEPEWSIVSTKTFRPLTEDELLNDLGIGFMGVKLQQIIDEFVE